MSASASERPPAAVTATTTAEDDKEPTPEEVAKARRVMMIGLVLGLIGAALGGFTGFTAPAQAKAKLATWTRTEAIVTDIETHGFGRRKRISLELSYDVNGETIVTEVSEGRSTDRKIGEHIAIYVSPKNLQDTEWASSVESVAKNSPIGGLFRGGAVGFFVAPLMAGILALVWMRLKEKFS